MAPAVPAAPLSGAGSDPGSPAACRRSATVRSQARATPCQTPGRGRGTAFRSIQLTSGQVAKLIVLAASWPLVLPPGAPHFRDVPPSNVFYTVIEVGYAHGILTGYSDGTYRPALPVTRAQLTKLIVLARGYALGTPATPTFSDVPATFWAYGYIETAAAHGIVGGYADHTFRPLTNATRAQFCKMLYQVYGVPSLIRP